MRKSGKLLLTFEAEIKVLNNWVRARNLSDEELQLAIDSKHEDKELVKKVQRLRLIGGQYQSLVSQRLEYRKMVGENIERELSKRQQPEKQEIP